MILCRAHHNAEARRNKDPDAEPSWSHLLQEVMRGEALLPADPFLSFYLTASRRSGVLGQLWKLLRPRRSNTLSSSTFAPKPTTPATFSSGADDASASAAIGTAAGTASAATSFAGAAAQSLLGGGHANAALAARALQHFDLCASESYPCAHAQ